jgi:hypothetical protein
LVRLKVDLIVARSSMFVQPAKEATSSIPIVFLVHADPVATGHVASLARPGGNITGLALLQTSCTGHSGRPKMFVTILCTSPGSRRVTQALNSVAIGLVRISLPLAVIFARVGYIGTLRLREGSASWETLPFNEGSLLSAEEWLPLAGFSGRLGASSIASW